MSQADAGLSRIATGSGLQGRFRRRGNRMMLIDSAGVTVPHSLEALAKSILKALVIDLGSPEPRGINRQSRNQWKRV